MRFLIPLLVLVLTSSTNAQIGFTPRWGGLIDGGDIVDGSIDSVEIGVCGQSDIPDTLMLDWIVIPATGLSISNLAGDSDFFIDNELYPRYDKTSFCGDGALSWRGVASYTINLQPAKRDTIDLMKSPGTIYFDIDDRVFYGWTGTIWRTF